jgi:hypothetical protein
MDEWKKSGSSGEEEARVEPYQLEEQVPQDEYSQAVLLSTRPSFTPWARM